MVVAIALALFIDYFLYGLMLPLMPHSPARIATRQVALVYGAYAVGALVATPLAAYLGERIGGRRELLWSLAVTALAAAILGLAPNVPLMVVARFCQGAASAALWIAALALIAEHYAAKRVEMIGYAYTGSTAGTILGPLLGGVLYQRIGYRLPFFTTEFLIAFDAVLLFYLVPEVKARRAHSNISGLLLNPTILAPALAVAFAALAWGMVEPLLPAHLAQHGIGTEAIGLMFTISALMYGLSSPAVGWATERIQLWHVVALGTIAMAATLPLLALFPSSLVIGFILCVINIAYAFVLNPATAELGNAVDRTGLSTYSAAYAVYNVAYSLGMMGTTGIAAVAVHHLGFLGSLLSVSVTLIVCLFLVLKMQQPRSGAAPADAAAAGQ
jgi:MFS family permease